MVLIIISLYLIISFLLTLFSLQKENEGLKIFLISLLLTPVTGLIYIIFKKKSYKKVHFYYCPECDYVFPVKMKYCPICEEHGKRVKLFKYNSPYKISDKIIITNFS